MEDHLYIFWTNPDPITAEKMVFMLHARNSILKQWWSKVTIIVWGGTTKLVAESKAVQEEIASLKKCRRAYQCLYRLRGTVRREGKTGKLRY